MENKFSYTYSAEKHAEIEKIRSKYISAPEPDDKFERLRRLDMSAERPGKIISVAVGLIGTLIFGGGLTMVLSGGMYVTGSVLGVIGMAVMGSAVPVCRKITEKQRKKIASEIIRLCDEAGGVPPQS